MKNVLVNARAYLMEKTSLFSALGKYLQLAAIFKQRCDPITLLLYRFRTRPDI